ncbi:hypothetical protein CAEBREN_28978 [Caenorhabditis brenneri]|uniref:Uncharacterized protein n=1 Tax=Caenorhabditis brenneri TaxID=135651 RepID=G0N8C1_CAEBE|nr:hypothetical protein CAEBREN_28978 [Caenorhabditis brenneri]
MERTKLMSIGTLFHGLEDSIFCRKTFKIIELVFVQIAYEKEENERKKAHFREGREHKEHLKKRV